MKRVILTLFVAIFSLSFGSSCLTSLKSRADPCSTANDPPWAECAHTDSPDTDQVPDSDEPPDTDTGGSDPLDRDDDGDGYSENDGDCNDGDVRYYPSAPEECTDPDYNCDGVLGTDNADGDSHIACQDCNDVDPAVNPAAEEVCDGIDNDCDGLVDPGCV